MHVCFNALDYPSEAGGGGVGNQVRLLGQALVESGHRVTVLDVAQKGMPDALEDKGVRVRRIRCGHWHWYLTKVPTLGRLLVAPVRELERSWAACRAIAELHRESPVDVIEGTETGMFWLPFWMPRLSYVVRLHGEPYTFRKYTPGARLSLGLRLCRLLQRVPLRRARLLISPSRAHAAEIARELGSIHPPFEVVPNVLAPCLIEAGRTERVPSSAPAIKGRIVLYAGRLEHGKGILPLLEAATEVLRTVPDAHFVLAGTRHPELPAEELESARKRVSCAERIHFLGHVPWQELLGWYRRAAVCTLPSFYETFGLAALEPMALGVPVVATRAAGLPEIVEDGVSGLLVPPGDSAALARAITRLLIDPEMGRRMGEEGRKRAFERFSMARHVNTNLELWQWVAETGGPSVAPREHLFFSPHLDDAVLSCGGLIHAAVARGERVRAITVFAGIAKRPPLSAFARHLHHKWRLSDSSAARLEEDRNSFRLLGVADVEHWELLEAPYRNNAAGQPLYCSYEDLKERPVAADLPLIDDLVARVRQSAPVGPAIRRLYFPLALGGHVDHRLLFQVGLRLRADGWDVRFYEDWPYAESYQLSRAEGWLSETIDVLPRGQA